MIINNYIIDKKVIFIIFFFHSFLLFINQNWDGVIIDQSFLEKDLSKTKDWYFESSRHFQFYIIKILFYVKLFLNLPNNLIFSLFSIFTIILLSFELVFFFKKNFNPDLEILNFVFLLTAFFPVWQSLTSFNLSTYLFCIFLTMLGYRLLSEKFFLIRILGIILIFSSFSIESNFAFVLGLVICEQLIIFLNNKKISKKKFGLILGIVLIGYLENSILNPPINSYSGYNSLSSIYDRNIEDILISLSDLFSFFLFFLPVPLIFLFLLKLNFKDFLNLFKKIIPVLILIIIVKIPYIIVNRSADIFYFSGFESRHNYLLSVGMVCLIGIILSEIKKNNKILFSNLKKLILFQSLILLMLMYFIKLNYSIINENIANTLKKNLKPESEYIFLVTKYLDLRSYEMDHILYKLYKEKKWNSRIVRPSELNNIAKEIKDNNKCVTIYKIENELSTKDILLKLYIFNQKKYFNLIKKNPECRI